ncbi:serine/threonine-protein kinase [Lyngbya sp. PCC 8106]|uniref:serine/threonine-protein kinase n=1 Tax=Lyngbya sp. (strain PCC 8106) TaxID=313612 RepID=UPI0000EAA00F|nr:serine/threonine-protein kinase [Lyngbya sp. PCC 8106]EAW38033.1 serine/threonine kinase [Lyngbya sp. PCC 8106]
MLGKKLRGRSEIIRFLGSGGFGKTYLARDHDLPRNPFCVVKQFQPQFHQPQALKQAQQLFQREPEVLYQLGHYDQIPRLFAHFQQEEFYIVQEYIEGHDLSQELQIGKQLSDFEVVSLLRGILEILEFVHQQQVIHRDIKPSNLIRITKDNKLVLIDFGAVKHVAVYNKIPGTVIGIPGYMSPEQARGKPQFSSDLYAVGILGIQALTGTSPHKLSESSHTGNIIVFPGFESLGRGIIFGMSLGIIYGLVRGFQGDMIQQKTFPNQGMFQSGINALIFAVIGFTLLGIAAGLLNWYLKGWVILGLCFGLIVGGGEACIKHFIVRVILYINGSIPWNYARFLNEATRRVLMQKVGGGYIFIHRLLLEHLAQTHVK